MRHLFIVNPRAGKRGSGKRLRQKLEGLDWAYEVRYTRYEGHARELAEEAVADGRPVRIYACGGDGTLNEVVRAAAGHDHVAVTNVPVGTGNDFLKLFGPENRMRFQDLDALREGPQAAMDLIDCNGRLGIGVACVGVDARIGVDAAAYKRLPLVRGIGAYILSLVVNLLCKGINQPTVVDLGSWHFEGETALICVCNGRYYGGGFMPVGEAMPDDGVLDILVVPKISRLTFLRMVGKYAKGRYRECGGLVRDYHGAGISFSSPEELVAVIDGEEYRARNFVIRLSDRKVNFFYPPDLSYRPGEEGRN